MLARLTELDVRDGPQPFAERLGDWLRWTDALPLYNALQDGAATPATAVPPGPLPADAPDAHRVHAELVATLEEDAPWQTDKPNPRVRPHLRSPAMALPVLETRTEFAPYRRHYQGRQIAMENAIEALRAALRARLLADQPALAAVDEVMERVLGAHERRLLMALPALLEKRFARLRATAEADPAAHTGWLDGFHRELQAVLAAELDLRWQPIEGLLAALHTQHETA